MKRIFTFSIILFLSFNIFSQSKEIKGLPGLNSEITYNFSIIDTTEYDLRDISKAEWDFSDLKSDNTVKWQTIKPENTPFFSLFPEANYSSFYESHFKIYNYDKITKKSISSIGFVGINNNYQETAKFVTFDTIIFNDFLTNDTILRLSESSTNIYKEEKNLYKIKSFDSCNYIYKQNVSLILPDNKKYNSIFVTRKYSSIDSVFINDEFDRISKSNSTYYDWYLNYNGTLINLLKIIDSRYEYTFFYLEKIEKLDGIIIEQ